MPQRKINKRLAQQPSRWQQTLTGLLLASTLIVVPSAMAEDNAESTTSRHYHISSGSLSHALSQFAGSAGILLSADARLTDGKSSPGLQGEYTVEEGLQKLLAGSGLVHAFTAGNTVTLKVAENQSQTDVVTLPVVRVTGKAVQDVNDPYNNSYSVTNSSTATRTDTPIMATPVSIQVIPKSVIKDQQAVDAREVMQNVSGVQQSTSPANYENFVIRGFDANGSVYRNGLRQDSFAEEISHLERIEVLKGPASVLYGRTIVDPIFQTIV